MGETEVAKRAANAAVAAHILAVDDDETSRELLADYLSEHEFRVTALPDGRATRKTLKESVVDLILDLRRLN